MPLKRINGTKHTPDLQKYKANELNDPNIVYEKNNHHVKGSSELFKSLSFKNDYEASADRYYTENIISHNSFNSNSPKMTGASTETHWPRIDRKFPNQRTKLQVYKMNSS